MASSILSNTNNSIHHPFLRDIINLNTAIWFHNGERPSAKR